MLIEPTVEQAEHCNLAQHEVIELINRLVAEGMDRRVVMAGVAAATAAAVMNFYGPNEVSIWFAKQSAMTMHLGKISS